MQTQNMDGCMLEKLKNKAILLLLVISTSSCGIFGIRGSDNTSTASTRIEVSEIKQLPFELKSTIRLDCVNGKVTPVSNKVETKDKKLKATVEVKEDNFMELTLASPDTVVVYRDRFVENKQSSNASIIREVYPNLFYYTLICSVLFVLIVVYRIKNFLIGGRAINR